MEKPYHLIFENSQSFKDYYLNNETEPVTYLPNFNTINIIVGANNSGKSRFMRYMMEWSFIGIEPNNYEIYNDKVMRYNNQNEHKHISQYVMKALIFNNNIIKNHDDNLKVHKNYITNQFKKKEYDITITPYFKFENKVYYIPTLRNAHSLFTVSNKQLKKIEDDIYLQTLENYYSINKRKENYIDVFTGMHLYKDILNSRNAKKEIRKRFESFEEFISIYFFDGKEIDIVAEFNKDNSLEGKNDAEVISVHIDGEKDRSLYQLGDGIQALIVLMYKIFMAEDESFFFVDEPELNLHPGMQRLFLEQISTNPELLKKNMTYVISTHSNHFLDLTLEKDNVSIYSFSPKEIREGEEKKFVIKNVNRGDNEILKHLGVNNSSVFLANCSIWVEGVSDRNYIKAFLKSYLDYLSVKEKEKYKSLKEDIDYAFFEYAGSNIEHYIFEEEISEDEEKKFESEINALALSNKIFLLADSDNADGRKSKGKRHKRLEETKKENFMPKIIKEVREIENLLTNKIWEKVLINFCNKKLLSEHREDIQNMIIEALKTVNSNDYKKEYIGVFLNEIDKKLGKIDGVNVLNKIYQENKGEYGTLIPKSDLSKYVLEANFEWEDLQESKEIKELTEEIYKFITDSMN